MVPKCFQIIVQKIIKMTISTQDRSVKQIKQCPKNSLHAQGKQPKTNVVPPFSVTTKIVKMSWVYKSWINIIYSIHVITKIVMLRGFYKSILIREINNSKWTWIRRPILRSLEKVWSWVIEALKKLLINLILQEDFMCLTWKWTIKKKIGQLSIIHLFKEFMKLHASSNIKSITAE